MAFKYQNFFVLPQNTYREKYGPTDISNVFLTEADLNYYITRGASGKEGVSEYWAALTPYPYEGQVVALVSGDKPVVYVLKGSGVEDANGVTTSFSLEQVGKAYIGDDKTVVVDSESGKISLKLPETIEQGMQPTLNSDGTISWAVPSTTTIEGMQSAIGGLQTAVGEINTKIDGLDVEDDGQDGVVVKVEQVDGKIEVTKAVLEISDITDLETELGKKLDSTTAASTYATKEAVEALTSATLFIGVTETALTDGGSEKPVIGEVEVEPQDGNVVISGSDEFIWSAGKWHKFGDANTYLLSGANAVENKDVADGALSQAKISGLTDALASKADKTATENAISGHAERLTAVEGVASAAKSASETNASAIEALQGRATTLEGRADALEGRADDLESWKEEIQGTVDALDSTFATDQALTDGLALKVDKTVYEAKVEELAAAIGVNKSAQEGNAAAIALLNNAAEVEGSVAHTAKSYSDALRTELSAEIEKKALDSDLDALADRVTTAEGAIQTNTGAISTEKSRAEQAEAGLQSQIDAVKATADAAAKQSDFTVLEGRVSDAEEAIETLQSESAKQSDLSALDARVVVVEGKIPTIEQGIQTNATAAATAQSAAETAQAAAEAAQSAADAAQGDVDALEPRVEAVEGKAAANESAIATEKQRAEAKEGELLEAINGVSSAAQAAQAAAEAAQAAAEAAQDTADTALANAATAQSAAETAQAAAEAAQATANQGVTDAATAQAAAEAAQAAAEAAQSKANENAEAISALQAVVTTAVYANAEELSSTKKDTFDTSLYLMEVTFAHNLASENVSVDVFFNKERVFVDVMIVDANTIKLSWLDDDGVVAANTVKAVVQK